MFTVLIPESNETLFAIGFDPRASKTNVHHMAIDVCADTGVPKTGNI